MSVHHVPESSISTDPLTHFITKYHPLNAKSDGHLFSSLKLSHYQGEKSSVRIKKNSLSS